MTELTLDEDKIIALEQAGFLVPAIRYPTVPRGAARLRISLSAAHPTAAVQALALTLSSA